MKKGKNKQITTKKPKNGLNIEELFFQLENESCDYENNAITLLPIDKNLENICKYICELYDNSMLKEKKKEAADYFREIIKNGYYNADKSLLRSKKGIETIFKRCA